MEDEYARLAEEIRKNASTHSKDRYLVAIAGIPGSGKSTTAEAVVRILNESSTPSCPYPSRAALLPMDGFHLPRSKLNQLPNREEAYIRRGAPWTFDAAGFVGFMKKLRNWADRPVTPDGESSSPGSLPSSGSLSSASKTDDGTAIYAPSFDHKTKDPVENGVCIGEQVSIVIIEGNYLLLDEPVWKNVATLVDYRVFIDVDLEVARDRLARRHVAAGIEKTLEDGYRRVDANDYLNALTILERRIQPDMIVPSVETT